MPSTVELKQSDPVVGQVEDAVLCLDANELQGDLSPHVARSVRTACSEHGFFFVNLTAAQLAAIEQTLAQMDRFFALPDEAPGKQATKQKDNDYGWVPQGTEPAYQPGTFSSLEAFDFGLSNILDRDSRIWPPLPGFADGLRECWEQYCDLGAKLLRVIALAAELPAEWLVDRCSSRQLNTMRLLHYAAEPNLNTHRDVGIAAHTDFECITLLYQTSAGLELLNTGGDWLDAPARDGRIVVLLGDMLERWTNGTFKASGHRVRNTPELRYSIVQFIAVNRDVAVAPLPQFVSVEQPANYTAIGQEEHIEAEIRRAQENARAASRDA